MSREAAAEKLQEGYQLRHMSFDIDNYIRMTSFGLIDTNGINYHEQFWTNDLYQSGWEIVN